MATHIIKNPLTSLPYEKFDQVAIEFVSPHVTNYLKVKIAFSFNFLNFNNVTKYQILSTFPKQFNSDILKIIQAYVFQNKAKIKLSIEVGFEDDFSISMRDIC
jgi:hypothetical protein